MFSYKPLCFADKYIPSPNEKMWSLLLTQAVFFFSKNDKIPTSCHMLLHG